MRPQKVVIHNPFTASPYNTTDQGLSNNGNVLGENHETKSDNARLILKNQLFNNYQSAVLCNKKTKRKQRQNSSNSTSQSNSAPRKLGIPKKKV